jgi:fucose permease
MAPLDQKLKRFIAALFLAFICYAFFTVLLGSQAPLMMQFYGINEAQQGFITTILSVGGIFAAVICALFGESFKKLNALGWGLAVLALATFLIALAPPYSIVVICALFAGIAYTFIDIMVNSTITQYFSSDSKKLLPMAHMFFGVGAMAGPYLMVAIVNPDLPRSFTLPYLLVGLLTAAVFVLYALSARRVSNAVRSASPAKQKSRPTEVFRTGKFWVILAAGVLFCCFTTGIVAWFPTYFNQSKGFSLEMSGLMLTLFFAGSLVMRFLGPFFFSKIRPQKIFITFSILSVAFMLLALSSSGFVPIVLFTVLSGAFQALNMPALIFIGCALFPNRHASASSIAIFSYNIGGIIAPLLLGTIADNIGFQIPMVLSCLLFAAGIAVMGVVSQKYKKALRNA